jgi:hypothetical protein
MMNVSPSSVKRAKTVLAEGTPEQIKAACLGECS